MSDPNKEQKLTEDLARMELDSNRPKSLASSSSSTEGDVLDISSFLRPITIPSSNTSTKYLKKAVLS
jgi:hypothetical protein